MAGYNGFSKSNNAIEAEDSGMMTASALAKKLGCDAAAVADHCSAGEWHHTSSHYNRTHYYREEALLLAAGCHIEAEADYDTDDIAAAKVKLDLMRAESAARKKVETTEIIERAEVLWLEWGGSRKHPRATERSTIARVEVRGGWAHITPEKKPTFRKNLNTRGFSFKKITI